MNLDKFTNQEILSSSNEPNISQFDSRIDNIEFNDSKDISNFNFDKRIIFEDDLNRCLEKFNDGYWETYDGYEIYDLIVELSSLIADDLGIKDVPIIEMYYVEDVYNYGYASFDNNKIGINCFNLDSPKEIVKVIAHETRHFWQKERIELPEDEQNDFDKVLKFNNENYVDPMDNYYAYWIQPMEIDCRQYADKFINKLSDMEVF